MPGRSRSVARAPGAHPPDRGSLDVTEGFQALKQWGERVRLQGEPRSEFADGLAVTLPK